VKPDAIRQIDLIPDGWQTQRFEPFHEGVEICWLVPGEPGVALLRYAPGARVPRHRHTGMETILVLSGSQSDEHGRYAAGAYVVNRAGTEHAVWTDEGCVVLIQWERPVAFVNAAAESVE
jgi:anti-sigma factor ChrR (cupin superfamily)